MPQRIDDDMALTPFDFFAGIEPAWPAGFGGLDRLAIDHTRRWCRCPLRFFTRHRHQGAVDPCQRAVARPTVKISLNRRERAEFLGICRHWHPVLSIYRIAFMITRRETERGRSKR